MTVPNHDPFDSIVQELDVFDVEMVPMEGQRIYIDKMLGEEARQQFQAIGRNALSKLNIVGDGLFESQIAHLDKVFKKQLDKGSLKFGFGDMVAVEGTGLFIGYDADDEIEFDLQIGTLTPQRRLFGKFSEVQYNTYPVVHDISRLTADDELDIVIDDDDEGFVICLDEARLCDSDGAGWEAQYYDRIHIPLADPRFLFYGTHWVDASRPLR